MGRRHWSRAAQHWPDNGGIQGAAELAAIKSELDLIGSTPPQIQASVGLAMLSSYAGSSANGGTPGSGGGYIRFAARDMTVAANKTALKNVLSGISSNINSPNEKLTGMSSKDEAAGFYQPSGAGSLRGATSTRARTCRDRTRWR